MRRLGSKKDAEEKRKRNTLILSIFMLFILVGGTAGYAFISNPSQSAQVNAPEENGSSLARLVGNQWVVTLNGRNLPFINSPESVADVLVNTTVSITTYSGLSLYISSGNSAVNAEITATLGNYASRVQRACYGFCEEDLPEKDCSDNLIVWKDSPQNRVYQEENCVFIEGDLRAVDAFLYKVLGIQEQ
ncbi:hypothetical protein J4233_00935 [Candidatus Pacearchaeota archaeon]|nr:hypothetical protein [uncultured archaeon]AQS28841.1 hypothetical protein [uncultured archaeon]AQS29028.1 hypothetical protein [uncultured archaeon]MBS3076815.1 hypothetical protein [Candidatus Pacearchaeota archaeon]